jgi:galactokinase
VPAPERGRRRTADHAYEPESHRSVAPDERCVRAFAPGRVNLIGEHTDYNGGLALPFAIAEGVTVTARAIGGDHVRVRAIDLDERDAFELAAPARTAGWRAFVRGIAAELLRARVPVVGAELEISGNVPRGAGLSSSAALEVALALALICLAGAALDRVELAALCSRVENEWLGAHTGLLDQLASLCGEPDNALRIDFTTLDIQSVPLVLAGGWRLVTLDSGDSRALAASGYNERRAECTRACELLGIDSLRAADRESLDVLPPTLSRRVQHVLEENARVSQTVTALHLGELERVGALLDAAHASLRDLYECSTAAVEVAVARLKRAGAVGARIVGGGFGGHVLGLFPPNASPPAAAREVRPSAGARLLDHPRGPARGRAPAAK